MAVIGVRRGMEEDAGAGGVSVPIGLHGRRLGREMADGGNGEAEREDEEKGFMGESQSKSVIASADAVTPPAIGIISSAPLSSTSPHLLTGSSPTPSTSPSRHRAGRGALTWRPRRAPLFVAPWPTTEINKMEFSADATSRRC